jgi:cytochrome P450
VDSINLTELAFWRRPDRMEAFAALRAERPVSWHEFVELPERGTKGFWAVTRYDDVVAVSTDAKTFVSGQSTYFGDHTPEEALAEGYFLNMDAPAHFALRHVVAKAFSPQNVARMREAAIHHAQALVNAAKARGACDFAKDIAQPFPVEVVCDFLGAPKENRKHLHALTITALAGDAEGADNIPRMPAAFAELNRYGAEIARERRKRPEGDDVLSLIVNAEIDGAKLTDEEAGMFFQLLVTAGMETTGTAAGHLMRLFLEHPDQMRTWAAAPQAVAPTGVEETVRYISPIMNMRRTAAVDTEIAGQKIAAGDKLVMWYNSANRDETKFAEPDRFDVLRNPNPHLGFGGGGRHTCLGAHLARLEIPLLFEAVFANLHDIEPAGPAVLTPSRFVNGLASLPITFKPA